MLRKIGQLTAISLKFFFDLDYAFCHHALLMTLLSFGILKFFFIKITEVFSNSWYTVKADFAMLRMNIASIKEQWENSETRQKLANSVRGLKDNFSERISGQW